MKKRIHKQEDTNSRRKFLSQSALLSSTVLFSGPVELLSASQAESLPAKNIASKGYAARDSSGKVSPWSFERRAVGDHDILIDIKFSGICHSDIHQMKGDWGPQKYPQVPGHEIAGVVAAVGKNVTQFKVGDHAGVGCMVDSCGTCESCKHGEEQHCDANATLFTYGYPDKTSPSGITQGGYANNLVVKEHFAIKIPKTMRLQDAAPLLCAGITTYSPLVKASIQKGNRVGIAGIGGLGHLAIKLAKAKGADVYAFTTSADKREDLLAFGAKEVIVVDSLDALKPYGKSLDYLISTIPVQYDVAAYVAMVKPYGTYTQVGMPVGFQLTISNIALAASRVKYTASLIGGIPQTQEVMDYCAQNNIYPQIQVIKAEEINDAWKKVLAKEARYRFVIDAATM